MTSSLQKFIIKNNGLVCDSEVRITLAKAEKMEETNQIKMTESFKRKCFQKTESKSLEKKDPILFAIIRIPLENTKFFSKDLISFLFKDHEYPDYRTCIWELCEFLQKNKDSIILFDAPVAHYIHAKEDNFSAISLISERKFVLDIFSLPYECKKDRKSLLSDKTVKIGQKEENMLSLKNFPLKLFKYEHLIYNYNYIFPPIVFLLLIIQNHFAGVALNMCFSEQKRFQKTVLEEKKLSNLNLLKKWIKKKPKDFFKDLTIYSICTVFLKFLKKSENEETAQKMIFRLIQLLDKKNQANELDHSLLLQFHYCKNSMADDDMAIENFYFCFTKLTYKEIAKTLTFIDIKLFLKMDLFNLKNNQYFEINNRRIISLSNFLELHFLLQTNKTILLANYFELARFLYQEKNYSSLYIIIIALVSKEIDKFLKENLANIEKYYINAAKDLNFYQKLYSDGFRLLKDKLNHHQNEKCPCIPLFKIYQREVFILETKYRMLEKKECLILEKILKKEKILQQISSFKKTLVRQASITFQNFKKNESYYFLKKHYLSLLEKEGK